MSEVEKAVTFLRASLGERLQTGDAIRGQHCNTTTLLPGQPPDAVVFPRTTDEVSLILRACGEFSVPVIPFGAGTSLEGQVNAPFGGISVDMREMNRIVAVRPDDLDCTVQAGVTCKELNRYIRDTGLFFSVDPGADASLGGMASTRASGTNAVRYGTMKDNVLAMTVVLPDGQVINTAQRARKSSAGYDLTRLMIGAEGTLGIITELTLRLHGIPEAVSSATCCFPDLEKACNVVVASIQCGIPVARIELLDRLSIRAVNGYSKLGLSEMPTLFLEFHGSENSVEEQAKAFGEIAADYGAGEFRWTTRHEEREQLWKARHDAYWAMLALNPGTQATTTDICVPISRLAECVTAAQKKAEEMDFQAPIIGHAGDGNFHVLLPVHPGNLNEIDKAMSYTGWLNDLAISLEGTCTGEHGIGQGKMACLERELGAARDLMVVIKRAIDPKNIMNPGKIFGSQPEL